MVEGVLTKMQVQYHRQSPVDYFLSFENSFIHLNQFIGQHILIEPQGCQCLGCHKTFTPDDVPFFFRRGYCGTCFSKRPEIGDWVISPELSQSHLDIEDRDLAYEKKYQLQPHMVYLAATSKIKVGVTRKENAIIRWVDQGAKQAIELLEVPNRYLAGITEVALKKYYSSATPWQQMLKGEDIDVDWAKEKSRALELIPNQVKKYINPAKPKPTEVYYPIKTKPTKPKSLSIDFLKNGQTPIEGSLQGIRGQYLLFDDQRVFNVRRHEGFKVKISVKI
ncbi:MAG: DUF2797 domain-containing protein [Flavobacteriaceae bacterium]|nr:DUF2797 domain-containing protein [Flavobacteriaceae bacterium]MCY4216647.1 DUF2797 domain-containing protein [Flavobacteriaceae bacterium]